MFLINFPINLRAASPDVGGVSINFPSNVDGRGGEREGVEKCRSPTRPGRPHAPPRCPSAWPCGVFPDRGLSMDVEVPPRQTVLSEGETSGSPQEPPGHFRNWLLCAWLVRERRVHTTPGRTLRVGAVILQRRSQIAKRPGRPRSHPAEIPEPLLSVPLLSAR